MYEIHLIIKGALADALRRGLVTRNVAVVARAPKQRSLQRTEGASLTEDELRQLLRTAAGHRLFPLYWLTAMTGMRRNEVLGLKWPDIDFKKRRLHLNRGLVAVGYEVHQTRGKTRNARRDHRPRRHHAHHPRRLAGVPGRRVRRRRHRPTTTGGCSPTATANPSTRTPSTRRSGGSCTTPASRRSDSTISATPTAACSSRTAIPVKVVSERLGHANIAFTMQTYQHVLPGMQADAARSTERLAKPAPPPEADTGERRGNPRRKTA